MFFGGGRFLFPFLLGAAFARRPFFYPGPYYYPYPYYRYPYYPYYY